MSCLICNELIYHMCEPSNRSKQSSSSWHELLTHVYLWTNHLCISHLNTLVHLGCHSITKTKQGPFTNTYTSDTTMSLILLDVMAPRRELNHGHTSCPTIAYVSFASTILVYRHDERKRVFLDTESPSLVLDN